MTLCLFHVVFYMNLQVHFNQNSGERMICMAHNVSIRNEDCIFTNNHYEGSGAVLYLEDFCDALNKNCTYENNTSLHGNIYLKRQSKIRNHDSYFR